MPRLESITVSHSILSLTCDRNKAVLKATFSPTSAVWHSGCSPCCLLTVLPAHRAPCSPCPLLTLPASHCADLSPRRLPATLSRSPRWAQPSLLAGPHGHPRSLAPASAPGFFPHFHGHFSIRNVVLCCLYYTVNKKRMT